MSLDGRARRAAASIRAAADVSPPSMEAVAGRRRFDLLSTTVAAAVAVAAVFFLAGLMRGPRPEDAAQPPPVTPPVAETTTTAAVDETTTTVAATTSTTPPAVSTTAPAAASPATTSTATLPADTTPPELVVTVPDDGAHTDSAVFRFRGLTEPGATVRSGKWQAEVDVQGHWALTLVLASGPNTVRFTATDAAGNEATATVTVYLDVPGGSDLSFTAHQAYGSCAESPPYDVFYGTGVPGTVVTVASPYGGGSTEVNDFGDWEIRVEFPEARLEERFEVVVEGEGGREVFTFIHTG